MASSLLEKLIWIHEMKLILLTSYSYPTRHPEAFFMKSMASALAKILKNNFIFLVRRDVSRDLEGTNAIGVHISERFRTIKYFFWIPFFIKRYGLTSVDTVFMSSDAYLLTILICWKKLLRLNYRICSDWHLLFDDWRDSLVSKNSNYLIATSKRLGKFIVSVCQVPPEKILIAYGGTDPSVYNNASQKSKEERRALLNLPDSYLVGYVGGFRSVGQEKGLNTMIKALPKLQKDITMVFVGGTQDHINEYILLAENLGVRNRCIFVKKQLYEKVVEYELAMDILVVPYPNTHHFRDYGFPMKIWEYLATGKPIVYSNLEIIREVLEKRGFPFIPDDAYSLVKTITYVYKNNEEVAKLAQKNTVDIYDFTWTKRAEKIIQFITLNS
jgi:glycosyltransferase involved in cell wall biosynthesis